MKTRWSVTNTTLLSRAQAEELLRRIQLLRCPKKTSPLQRKICQDLRSLLATDATSIKFTIKQKSPSHLSANPSEP
jgi:hypothetical protein